MHPNFQETCLSSFLIEDCEIQSWEYREAGLSSHRNIMSVKGERAAAIENTDSFFLALIKGRLSDL